MKRVRKIVAATGKIERTCSSQAAANSPGRRASCTERFVGRRFQYESIYENTSIDGKVTVGDDERQGEVVTVIAHFEWCDLDPTYDEYCQDFIVQFADGVKISVWESELVAEIL